MDKTKQGFETLSKTTGSMLQEFYEIIMEKNFAKDHITHIMDKITGTDIAAYQEMNDQEMNKQKMNNNKTIEEVIGVIEDIHIQTINHDVSAIVGKIASYRKLSKDKDIPKEILEDIQQQILKDIQQKILNIHMISNITSQYTKTKSLGDIVDMVKGEKGEKSNIEKKNLENLINPTEGISLALALNFYINNAKDFIDKDSEIRIEYDKETDTITISNKIKSGEILTSDMMGKLGSQRVDSTHGGSGKGLLIAGERLKHIDRSAKVSLDSTAIDGTSQVFIVTISPKETTGGVTSVRKPLK